MLSVLVREYTDKPNLTALKLPLIINIALRYLLTCERLGLYAVPFFTYHDPKFRTVIGLLRGRSFMDGSVAINNHGGRCTGRSSDLREYAL